MEIAITPLNEPSARKVILCLIQEELKNRKLFRTLHHIGLHCSFYQANLAELIILAIGLRPDSSIDRALCHVTLNRHSHRITEDIAELADEAEQVYDILLKHALQFGNPPMPQSLNPQIP